MKLAVELYSISYFAVELYRMRNGCTETHFNLDSVKNRIRYQQITKQANYLSNPIF